MRARRDSARTITGSHYAPASTPHLHRHRRRRPEPLTVHDQDRRARPPLGSRRPVLRAPLTVTPNDSRSSADTFDSVRPGHVTLRGGALHHPGRDVDIDPEPIRSDALRPPGVDSGTNARCVAIHIDGLDRLTRGHRGAIAVDGSSKTAIMPSPIRLTIRPPESRIGGSPSCATLRSNRSVASSPASKRPNRRTPPGR